MVEQEPNRSIKGVKIEGVPFLKQARLECGYASLAMLIQHRGLQDVSTKKIFETVNGEGSYDPAKELNDPTLRPTMGHFGDLVEELTDGKLAPIFITQRLHKMLAQKNPKLATPPDVLQYYLLAGFPAMIRTPGHFSVVTGFDFDGGFDRKGVYFINDPLSSGPQTEGMSILERQWGKGEYVLADTDHWHRGAAMLKSYPEDPQYQMLIVRPVKKS